MAGRTAVAALQAIDVRSGDTVLVGGAALDRITDAISGGRLTVPIAATFPIEQIREAVTPQPAWCSSTLQRRRRLLAPACSL